MLNTTERKSRYMPGLDGLRAISVLAVIAYHLNLTWAPGGFLGVGVFFVLSGYLITDQLVAKWQRDRRLDLKGFWLRRARRLLPAMLLMTAIVCGWLALTDPVRLRTLGGDVLSAVTYVNNWWLIYHQVSYFESFGPPSPFGHYWSLAVEEQFYLLWPLLLAVGLRFVPRRGPLAGLILAGAAASAVAMALLYTEGADPSRVYYGSDTRVFALLIGAALAVVWPSARLSEKAGRGTKTALNVIGVLALGVLLYTMWNMQEYDSFVYRGGLVLVAVVTAVLVAALAHPASGIGRALSAKPLRWLGVRSYGIYLWHYPVIALTSPLVDTDGFDAGRAALQVAATLVLASLSWKFVEKPILRGAWKSAAVQQEGTMRRHKRKSGVGRHLAAAASSGMIVVLCVSCVGMGQVGGERHAAASEGEGIEVTAPPSTSAAGGQPSAEPPAEPPAADVSGSAGGTDGSSAVPAETADASPGDTSGAGVVIVKPSDPAAAGGGAGSSGSGSATGTGASSVSTGGGKSTGAAGGKAPSSPSSSAPAKQSGKGITIIGDSVILGVQSAIEKIRPGIVVDGKVGRQLTQAFDTVDAHAKAGDLGSIVILELGTNGTFTEKKLGQLLDKLGGKRQILVVNTRVPRKWQDDVNKMLAQAAKDRDNVTLVDWYAESKGKDAYFGKDGVHPSRTGAADYAAMLSDAIDLVQGKA